MKNLYFVRVYSHHHNQWARYLVTAMTQEEAQKEVEESESKYWQVRGVEFICTTTDEVHREV